MKEEFREPYEKFLKAWGEDAQIMMVIEEMSELTKELCKYLRYKGFKEKDAESVVENINEETADVLNCVEQLELIFNEKKINEIRKEKIDRTLKKV